MNEYKDVCEKKSLTVHCDFFLQRKHILNSISDLIQNLFVKTEKSVFITTLNFCVAKVDGEMAPSGLTGKSAFAEIATKDWLQKTLKMRFFLRICVSRERCQ